jgi:hypothetical protein
MSLSKIDICAYITMLKLMKSRIPALCLALLALSCPLGAEEVVAEEKVIPTEISEPPYQVGELPTEQGYYIERAGQTSINFRIVSNRMRVYWIDEDGLIAEPEATAGNVRFTVRSKQRDFYNLSPLPGDVGLGSAGFVRLPHLFNMVLFLKNGESEGGDSYAFRYLISMDTPVESAELDASSEN